MVLVALMKIFLSRFMPRYGSTLYPQGKPDFSPPKSLGSSAVVKISGAGGSLFAGYLWFPTGFPIGFPTGFVLTVPNRGPNGDSDRVRENIGFPIGFPMGVLIGVPDEVADKAPSIGFRIRLQIDRAPVRVAVFPKSHIQISK